MGHFLSTVNPQAAADIRPEVELVLPEVGDTLKFFPRNGEARGGRTDYFIQVTRVHPDGRVDGIVPYDAADGRDVVNVPYLPTVPRHPGEALGQAWDWRASDRRGTMIVEPAAQSDGQLSARIDELTDALTGLWTDQTALLERVGRLEEAVAVAPRVKRKYVRKTLASSA